MNTQMTRGYTVLLTEEERETLLNVLEEVLKATQVELHRTEAFAARKVVGTHEAKLETLLHKVREALPD